MQLIFIAIYEQIVIDVAADNISHGNRLLYRYYVIRTLSNSDVQFMLVTTQCEQCKLELTASHAKDENELRRQ